MSPSAKRFAILLLAITASPALGVEYLRDVKPLLQHKCYACHGVLRQQSGLRLDTAAAVRAGGDSGVAVEPGKPGESLLMEVLTGDAGFRMPPENEGSPLSKDEVEVIREWIASGAEAPKDEQAPADPTTWWSYRPIVRPPTPHVRESDWPRASLDFFIAAARETERLPHAGDASSAVWLRRVYLDLIGLPPTRAELHQFLPHDTPERREAIVDALLARPQYGERWGRHWMDVWRYSDWYGSRGGNEIRYSQRHIWRWRDWIVRSLNNDKGYDQMVREMLAADEVAGDDLHALPATGYLGRSWYKFDRDVWLFETVERAGEAFLGLTLRCTRCHDHKFDPVSHEEYYRFRAFFEPHDVRTDPISARTTKQKDAKPGQVLKVGVAVVYDKDPAAPTYRFERGDGRYPDKTKRLTPGVPASLGGDVKITPVNLPTEVWYPALRPGVRETFVEQASATLAQAEKKLAVQLAAVDQARQQVAECKQGSGESSATTPAPFLHDDVANPRPETRQTTHGKGIDAQAESLETLQRRLRDAERAAELARLQVQLAQAEVQCVQSRLEAEISRYFGDDAQATRQLALAASQAERYVAVKQAEVNLLQLQQQGAGEAVKKKLLDAEKKLAAARKAKETPSEEYAPLGDQFPRTSTGRRAALANWIVSPENLRTARVAANHLWGRHFGQPLVATPENFGLNGRKPTHPQLLDWLASELIANGWRMKPLHRQIVLSRTYAMSSRSAGLERALAKDGDNRVFWRMNSRRMEAEVVRDSSLYIAGRLDLSRGGPEIPETDGETVLRRSLYFRNTPNEKMRMLEVFDVADPNSCYRRKESVVPHQSLALMNSGLTLDNARTIAERLAESRDGFVEAAFETVLSRRPSPAEAKRCRSFLEEHEQLVEEPTLERFAKGGTAKRAPASDPTARARENLVHVLLLHNDFITVR